MFKRFFISILMTAAMAAAFPQGAVLITVPGQPSAVKTALDSVKRWTPETPNKIKVRNLRDELLKNAEEGLEEGQKLQAHLKTVEAIGDTIAIKKARQAFEDWAKTDVPLSVKVPIKIRLSPEFLGRVVDYDMDVILKGLIDFGPDVGGEK